ncbi:hypothetical protein PHLGIDRAFT_223846 [Phlebiopsis gigantea 11061_1 CR5-6]|uniref:Uncharacterized protein n=1 Tax=Phlebiopsis gigantea (strain 11061_1 CR5-6) TaxID=745531 RepID=A0A0C3NGH0_PHLG1|nr:hypothetical protein PHLGIDRAFT_223846 [Phlebiopsis gigantea 11061_1 CR5-6]
MQDACKEWADWDHRSAILETDVDQGCFTPTSIFGNISFNNKFRARYFQKLMQGVDMDIGAVAFLRTPVASDAPAWTRADLLNKHPIAMLSDVESRTGVTVRDVILRLGQCLHNEFSVPDLSERLSMISNAPREGIFPSTWSVADVLAAVPNVGNLFQLVNWAGLQYEENDGMYRWFSCDFEYKPLPASVETHLRQYDPDATFSSKSGRAHINAGVQTDA